MIPAVYKAYWKYLVACTLILCMVGTGCTKDSDENLGIHQEKPHSFSNGNVPTTSQWHWKDSIYGDRDKNDFSIFYSQSSSPATPLIIAMHGGGFQSNSKEDMLPDKINFHTSTTEFGPLISIEQLINNGIAYATINYTLVKNDINVDVPLNDLTTFLSFIKKNAITYNIDTSQIILMGYSSGASISLWYGLHKPGIKGIVALSPQASLNLLKWNKAIFLPLGEDRNGEISSAFKRSAYMLYGTEDPSKINRYSFKYGLHYLDSMDLADPEIYLCSSSYRSDVLHHLHVNALMQKANEVGLKANVMYIKDPFFFNANPETVMGFCVRKFREN